ncbi:MAG TPA: DNA translocase FtsK [Candidatus Paceibacterota bacterium]|jgi:S-DNA-T family DNA segregation ATPase FtsK/SpoIIIE|nr:DNA translocase FtsK [Candidatus Paceibacterota bacterium]
MAKKSSKKNPPQKESSQTNHVVLGLLLILVGLIAVGGFVGTAGTGGFILAEGSYMLLGVGKYLVPIVLLTAGFLVITKRNLEASIKEVITSVLGLLALLTLASLYDPAFGGIIGHALSIPLIGAFDTLFSSIILIFISITCFILFFDRSPNLFPFFTKLWNRMVRKNDELSIQTFDNEPLPPMEVPEDNEEAPSMVAPAKAAAPKELTVNDASSNNDLMIDTKKHSASFGAYVPPPLNLLEGDRGKANVGDVKANANIIRRTLLNFGIEVEMDEVTIGPTVTRYALKPAQGVKLSRIVGLQNDLALALAAHPLRIEAPIPGKSLVGIEIPNKTKATVGLASLLSDPAFTQDKKPLLAALGRNIAGKPVLKSIAKMPHLLIAGTTGSGKSATIHAIITSLLYRHGPDDLRFIFVDPKRVELTLYNSIPHLLTPVITDPKKAILALKWAATEMSRRYDILEGESVRDIDSYRKKYEKEFAKPTRDENGPDRMPFIVITIDEVADIMQAYPRELEAAVVRLAQMSRAVGIHLILSTQRPEVNVITGLIKANVPSRIALRVATGIDSRTILDTTGAEKLLGQGDMLAMVGGDNQAERLQSAFITEDEVKSVVNYLKKAFKDDVRDTIELSGTVGGGGDKTMFGADINGDNGDDDELYEEARTVVMEAGKASTSYIQRKLKVGYARAARLIDMLEERGIVGPADGAKPRDVLVGGMKDAVSDQVAEDMGL